MEILSSAKQNALLRLIAGGVSRACAAVAIGSDKKTMARTVRKDKVFGARVRKAEAVGEAEAVGVLRAAMLSGGQGSVGAAQMLLRERYEWQHRNTQRGIRAAAFAQQKQLLQIKLLKKQVAEKGQEKASMDEFYSSLDGAAE